MNEECCNYNCNQGRDCPRRNLSKEITEGFKALEIMRNNKPVAWIDHQDLERLPHHDCWVNGQEHKNSVPLYTHPVKELTDEEVLKLWAKKNKLDGAQGIVDFARAILRKAQEK